MRRRRTYRLAMALPELVLMALGLGLLTTGCALVYRPLGFILPGLALICAALFLIDVEEALAESIPPRQKRAG